MINVLDSVVKVDKNNLIEYDSYERTPKECSYYLDSYEPIGGGRVKKFYRASSELLIPLIDDIAFNPNCSYITSFNNLIQSGYRPKYLSVLIKDFLREGCKEEDKDLVTYNYCAYHNGMREVLCSRINNFMGVPTTYEMLIDDNDRLKVLSVDFGSSDKMFNSFEDIGCPISCDLQIDVETLSTCLDKMYNSAKKITDVAEGLIGTIDKDYKSNKIVDKEEFIKQKNKLIEDFIYSYLVRDIVMGDFDIHSANFGIMIGDDMSVTISPAFDLEGTLGDACGYLHTYNALENLRWVSCVYENVFLKFRNKVKELIKIKNNDKFSWKEILFKDITSEIPDEFISFLDNQLDNAVKLCDKTIYIPDNEERGKLC